MGSFRATKSVLRPMRRGASADAPLPEASEGRRRPPEMRELLSSSDDMGADIDRGRVRALAAAAARERGPARGHRTR